MGKWDCNLKPLKLELKRNGETLFVSSEAINNIEKYVKLIHENLPHLKDKFTLSYVAERVETAKAGILHVVRNSYNECVGLYALLDEGIPETIYSWLGILRRDYRGFGISPEIEAELSKQLSAQGYKTRSVKTGKSNNQALISLLKGGFELNSIDSDGVVELYKHL